MNYFFKKNRFQTFLLIALSCALLIPAFAFSQSGRQTPPPPKPTTQKPTGSTTQQETRPRRVNQDDPQDDSPIKLSADLVTAITSVTDPAGNQINDLTKQDFVVYEDNKPQDLEGVYREGQLPLRLVFLFDTSTSIRGRFDFEQRAAAQFFRNT